jgi:hypothetical protein
MVRELLYDWRFIANQFVLATIPLRLTTRIFFPQLNTYGFSPHVTSSLTRGWVYRLELLPVSLAQSFLVPSPAGPMKNVTVSHSKLPQPGGPGLLICIPHEYGGSAITPSTGIHFSSPPTTSRTMVEVFEPAPHGEHTSILVHFEYPMEQERHRKHSIQQFLYCCECIRACGNVFTETMPNNVTRGHPDIKMIW